MRKIKDTRGSKDPPGSKVHGMNVRQNSRKKIVINYANPAAFPRVEDKSRQPAKYEVSPATFTASRARTEMMFIGSKLGLSKNINLHCLSFLKT